MDVLNLIGRNELLFNNDIFNRISTLNGKLNIGNSIQNR